MSDYRNRRTPAPLGSIVAFSDGTPRPPERFKRKLSDWENRNGNGRLVNRKASTGRGDWDVDSITLETGRYGDSERSPVLIMNRCFGANSALDFAVESYVPAGRTVLLTHSVHVGTEFKGSFGSLEEARADIERGHRHSDWGLYRVGENGTLTLAEGPGRAARQGVGTVSPLEEIRTLLDRAAEIADELTNAESDHRHASRLSRISDGLDLARERLADCEAAR